VDEYWEKSVAQVLGLNGLKYSKDLAKIKEEWRNQPADVVMEEELLEGSENEMPDDANAFHSQATVKAIVIDDQPTGAQPNDANALSSQQPTDAQVKIEDELPGRDASKAILEVAQSNDANALPSQQPTGAQVNINVDLPGHDASKAILEVAQSNDANALPGQQPTGAQVNINVDLPGHDASKAILEVVQSNDANALPGHDASKANVIQPNSPSYIEQPPYDEDQKSAFSDTTTEFSRGKVELMFGAMGQP